MNVDSGEIKRFDRVPENWVELERVFRIRKRIVVDGMKFEIIDASFEEGLPGKISLVLEPVPRKRKTDKMRNSGFNSINDVHKKCKGKKEWE